MKTRTILLTLLVSAAAAHTLVAQGMPGAVKEHQWLKKFVGQWDLSSEGSMGEGQPTMKGTAVMDSSMLGSLWVVNASDMDVAGMKMKSLQMVGYDPSKKKYVGIWADSMVNHLWQYEGTVDESGNKLTLEAEGPSIEGDGSMAKYRDAYEFTDEDTIVATSSMQNEQGEWVVFMTGTATRRKSTSDTETR